MVCGQVIHQVVFELGSVVAMTTLEPLYFMIRGMFRQQVRLQAILRLGHELAFVAFNPLAAVVMDAVMLIHACFGLSLVLAFVALVPLDLFQSQMMPYRVTLQVALVVGFVRTLVTFVSRTGGSRLLVFVPSDFVTFQIQRRYRSVRAHAALKPARIVCLSSATSNSGVPHPLQHRTCLEFALAANVTFHCVLPVLNSVVLSVWRSVVSVFVVFVQSNNEIGGKIALFASVLLQFVVFTVEKFQPQIVAFPMITHKVIRFCTIRTNVTLVNTRVLTFQVNFLIIFTDAFIFCFEILFQSMQIQVRAFALRFELQHQIQICEAFLTDLAGQIVVFWYL
jgi:hypothetical protein